MQIEECTIDNVPLLAKMNKEFIEDGKADTDYSLPHLEERLRSYISSEHKAYIFREDESIVGYALCDVSKNPVYMRQFFISRGERRKGLGKQAFQLLLEHLGIGNMDIEVYSWNESGIAFLKSLGLEKQRNIMSKITTQL